MWSQVISGSFLWRLCRWIKFLVKVLMAYRIFVCLTRCCIKVPRMPAHPCEWMHDDPIQGDLASASSWDTQKQLATELTDQWAVWGFLSTALLLIPPPVTSASSTWPSTVSLWKGFTFSSSQGKEGHLLHSTEQEGQLVQSTRLTLLLLTLPDTKMLELQAPMEVTPYGRDKKTKASRH